MRPRAESADLSLTVQNCRATTQTCEVSEIFVTIVKGDWNRYSSDLWSPAAVMSDEKKAGFGLYRALGSPVNLVAPMVDASELAWRVLSRR